MTKKLIISVIASVLLVVAIVALSSQLNSNARTSAQNNSSDVPDEIAYRHLFRHVAALKIKADDTERQGKNAAHFRGYFKHKANLSDDEAQVLDRIASQCASEIKAIDERAKPIIEAYKAQYPNGQVPHGQQPLPPPVELRQMSQERNNLVLGKRDELRAAFGEEAFGRFQNFVKNKVTPNVTAASEEQ